MKDFGAAIGLVFAIEGLVMAAFTEPMKRSMAAAAQEDSGKLRGVGIAAAAIGVAIVWAVRTLL